MITGEFIELACKDKSCAPPPVGTGGSAPSGMRPNLTLRPESYIKYLPKLGLVKSFDADSELDEHDANQYYKDLSRIKETNIVSAAVAVGKLMEGKVDFDSMTAGRFMAESLTSLVLNNEYVKSFDGNGDRDIDSSGITVGSMENSGLLSAVVSAFRDGKGSTVADRVLAETGVTLEAVLAYGMTTFWNVQQGVMTRRMMDRVGELFPAHGADGHAPPGDVVAGYEKELELSRSLFPDKVVDTVLRSMYENTQNALRKAGVTDVTVARGVSFSDPDIFRKPDGSEFESVQIDVRLRPLSSYAGNASDAKAFAGVGGMYFVTKVPASRVFSTALTGFGTTGESEVVVLGGTYRSTVIRSSITDDPVERVDRMIDA